MQPNLPCHSQLAIPPQRTVANVEKYAARQFRRVLANWAFDLLTKDRPILEAAGHEHGKRAA